MERKRLLELMVTCGGIGYIRKAPGSFGSLGGLISSAIIFSVIEDFFLKVFILILATCASYWIIKLYEMDTRSHDASCVVIDEWIAQSWVVAFFPLSFLNLTLGFVLFRFFDILKPFPISWIDNHMHSSFGTLLDDLVAALASFFLLLLVNSYT